MVFPSVFAEPLVEGAFLVDVARPREPPLANSIWPTILTVDCFTAGAEGIVIANPALFGAFEAGDTFYVDFIPAPKG